MKVMQIVIVLCSFVGAAARCDGASCEDATSLMQVQTNLKPTTDLSAAQAIRSLIQVSKDISDLDKSLSTPSAVEDDSTANMVSGQIQALKQKLDQQDALLKRVLANQESRKSQKQKGQSQDMLKQMLGKKASQQLEQHEKLLRKVLANQEAQKKQAPGGDPGGAPASDVEDLAELNDDRIEGIGKTWNMHTMDPFLASTIGATKVYQSKLKAFERAEQSANTAWKRAYVDDIEDNTKAEMESIHAGKRAYTSELNMAYADWYGNSPYHAETAEWEKVGRQEVGGKTQSGAGGAAPVAAPAPAAGGGEGGGEAAPGGGGGGDGDGDGGR